MSKTVMTAERMYEQSLDEVVDSIIATRRQNRNPSARSYGYG